MPTHEVTNQPPPLVGYDASDDPALPAALERLPPRWHWGPGGTGGTAVTGVAPPEIGRLAGGEHAQEQGRLANENPPKLRTHDRYGHRIDEVEFHPAWHDLMATAIGHGLHATPWQDRRPGAHLDRAARFYVWGQAEAGHLCPVSMTYAIVPALRHAPDLARQYEPLLAATDVRPEQAAAGRQAGPDRRHVDDGEAGRLRRPRQHHDGDEDGRRQLPHHRPQVVHVRPDGRPLHGPGPDAGRPELLPAAQGPARRHPQRDAPAAAQGQAGQPLERLRRGRVRQRDGLARRRGGPRRPDHPRHGQRDPPGLRAGRRDRPAPWRHPRGAPREPPCGVRQEAHRPAPDGQRPRRPGHRVRGRHHGRAAAGRRGRPRGERRRRREGLQAAGPGRHQVPRLQAGPGARRRGPGMPGRQRLRRGVRHCPGCTARRRSSRSGRARATSPHSTRCAR